MSDQKETDLATRLPNINIGVLGHVDSGKTSLVRALSTQLSTAALDKHPQSQERGITLDLGFSAFTLHQIPDGPEIQVTLVDCPGHASLFKTILGGIQIIDMVILVVDVQKGLQPQTIESLLAAGMAVGPNVVIALNKIDLVPASTRSQQIERVTSEIYRFLRRHFPKICNNDHQPPIVPVAVTSQSESTFNSETIGLDLLLETLGKHVFVPVRDASGPFSLAIDHCFAIQGNGTILTGTVLSGQVAVGDSIELTSLQVVKKVKSIQKFKRSAPSASQGDRIGIRVNGLDASLVERGMAVTPQSIAEVMQVIIPVHQIALFQAKCKSGGKFHVTVSHMTVVAVATFFTQMGQNQESTGHEFHAANLYEYVDEIDTVDEDEQVRNVGEKAHSKRYYFALLQFDRPVLCRPGALVVCSRLDLDPKKFHCRLAFHGTIQTIVTAESISSNGSRKVTDFSTNTTLSPSRYISMQELRIGRIKTREGGVVDKMVSTGKGEKISTREVIGRDMFSKDIDWSVYLNVVVMFETTHLLGKILAPFGKTGKFRIELLGQLVDKATTTSPPLPPSVGERFLLRFVKLVSIKPPKLATTKSGNAAKGSGANTKAARNLLQDIRILYPEAFVPRNSPNLSSVPIDKEETAASNRAPSTTEEPMNPVIPGKIERLKGETTADGRNPFAIVTELFSTEEEAREAVGRIVVVCRVIKQENGTAVVEKTEERGKIEKPFGKAGKVRVDFTDGGGTNGQIGDLVYLLSEEQSS